MEALPLSLALRHQSLACHSRFALKCEKGKRTRRTRQVHWILFPKYELLKAPNAPINVNPVRGGGGGGGEGGVRAKGGDLMPETIPMSGF